MENKISENLFKYAEKHHLSQCDIGKMLGVSENTVCNWKRGCAVSAANAKAIACLIHNAAPESNARFCTPDEFIAVPLLSLAQAAELSPRGNMPDISPESGDVALFSKMWAKPGDFAVVVSGRSMCPWYPQGTRVLVGLGERPQSGNRVACMLADREEPVFKIYVDLGSEFALLSINKEEGLPPLILDKMDGEAYAWCWPIKASARDERALDAEMKKAGIHHFWEAWLDNYQKEGGNHEF
ncbi:MAG: S24 family peptidase [Victivallaceae bacterium]|nr:S24 family peptidase [Victivallaceae bacterium]